MNRIDHSEPKALSSAFSEDKDSRIDEEIGTKFLDSISAFNINELTQMISDIPEIINFADSRTGVRALHIASGMRAHS